MKTFQYERKAFDILKERCAGQVRREYETAISMLLERYNTTIHENRFVAGGAVEVFTYALLKSVGIDCNLYADQSKGGDILLPGDRKLSVKGSFTGRVSSVKLINQLGTGTRTWDTATLFVVSGIGIVYGTPAMVAPEHIRETGDGTELKRAGLQGFIDDERNVFSLNIPPKPPPQMTGFSHKASTAVARQILMEMNAEGLMSAFNSGQ